MRSLLFVMNNLILRMRSLGANKLSKAAFTLVELLIVCVIVVLLIALAYPALDKVREKYQERAIVENLEEVAAKGLLYMEEKSVQSVDVPTLSASGYLESLESVAGEDYSGLKVIQEGGHLSVSDENGNKVNFKY